MSISDCPAPGAPRVLACCCRCHSLLLLLLHCHLLPLQLPCLLQQPMLVLLQAGRLLPLRLSVWLLLRRRLLGNLTFAAAACPARWRLLVRQLGEWLLYRHCSRCCRTLRALLPRRQSKPDLHGRRRQHHGCSGCACPAVGDSNSGGRC